MGNDRRRGGGAASGRWGATGSSREVPAAELSKPRTAGGDYIASPAKRAVGIPHAVPKSERSMKANGESRKILVIDDDDELAEVVRQVLRDAGYSVATVKHGAAALEFTTHIAPDLILLDLSMPIMDG